MSAESTEAVFAALALANIPPHSWNVQTFTDHQQGSSALSVTGYQHTIDAAGVVALSFTVTGASGDVTLTGKFKKGTVNQVALGGAVQPPPTFDGPVDAGTGAFDANGIKTQIWLRYEAGNHLKEDRFETSIHFPKPLSVL